MDRIAVLYGERDCLSEVCADLCDAARTVLPWDADAREGWMDAAVWLLKQVPHEAQRASWAFTLATAINRCQAPVVGVLGELWRRVEGAGKFQG